MYQMYETLQNARLTLQYLYLLPLPSRALTAQQDLIYNKANITAQKHTVWFPSSLCWVHRDRKFGKILTRRVAYERAKTRGWGCATKKTLGLRKLATQLIYSYHL